MLQKSKLKLAMRTAAATLAIALGAVGAVGATTTIGTNISTDGTLTVASTSTLQGAVGITSTTNPQLTVKYDTANYMTQGVSATGVVTLTRYGSALQKGFTLADTVAIASSTLQTLLTIESSASTNASTTLAVYQFGTGDIMNLYDGGTAVFTVKDGGKIGVGSSTPYALLSVAALTGQNAFIVGSSSVELFKIDSSGAVSFNGGGWSTADLTIQGDTVNNLVTVDASADSVGIASSTPWGLLSVEQGTETRSLIVMNSGSSTPSFIINGVNGNGRVGIATSSPTGMFSVGGTGATSTIDFGKACFRTQTDLGTTIYWWFTNAVPGLGNINIATSTTSCGF